MIVSERSQFVEAIYQNPREQSGYLVFADFLEEQNEHDPQMLFIRASIDHAHACCRLEEHIRKVDEKTNDEQQFNCIEQVQLTANGEKKKEPKTERIYLGNSLTSGSSLGSLTLWNSKTLCNSLDPWLLVPNISREDSQTLWQLLTAEKEVSLKCANLLDTHRNACFGYENYQWDFWNPMFYNGMVNTLVIQLAEWIECGSTICKYHPVRNLLLLDAQPEAYRTGVPHESIVYCWSRSSLFVADESVLPSSVYNRIRNHPNRMKKDYFSGTNTTSFASRVDADFALIDVCLQMFRKKSK